MQKEDLIHYWQDRNIISDPKILEAFKKISREDFVLKGYKEQAYKDIPLPILEGQTISQPTTVLLMTEALSLQPGQNVLEIGTGSGYQSAIISEIIKPGKIFSIEIIPELVQFAKKNIKKSKIKNVEIIEDDGNLGLKKQAPFDRIIMTAAASKVPKTLLKQLKKDGIFLGPIGNKYSQEMARITKLNSKFKHENLGDFVFVPLQGKYGYY